MSKLYTSRFSNPELKYTNALKVAIVKSLPKYQLSYSLSGNIVELSPPGYLFKEYNEERFTTKFFQYLDNIGVERIRSELKKVGYGEQEEIILLCYEDVRQPEVFCHRQIFAKWWEKKTGEKIEEYQDNSSKKWEIEEQKRLEKERKEEERRQEAIKRVEEQRRQEEEHKKLGTQLNLF